MIEATPSPDALRSAMALMPTGVTIVTAPGGAGPAGATANAVASLSLDPPLMLACLDRTSRTLAALIATERFAVNVLRAEQAALARAFAGPFTHAERFAEVPWTERHGVPVLDDAGIAELLRSARRIAVVGASSRPGRPSRGVVEYLVEAGYDVVPVNPNEREVAGRPAFPTLEAAVAATGPVDIVDVFRRSELCVPHAREAVAVGARCLWLQLGVVNWEAARIAHEGGLAVVMDRCTAIEHRRLGRRP